MGLLALVMSDLAGPWVGFDKKGKLRLTNLLSECRFTKIAVTHPILNLKISLLYASLHFWKLGGRNSLLFQGAQKLGGDSKEAPSNTTEIIYFDI